MFLTNAEANVIHPLRLPVALLLLCAWSMTLSAAAISIPSLTGRVVDDAGILKPETRARLTAALKAHEEATTNQIVVLTVPTIRPDDIEDYAVKVFESWKLGQKGKDNGVLVVVVPNDHKMRIEVGYGLEPTLTDAMSGRIIQNVMTPQFKNGNYDQGIEDGVKAIVGQLDGTGDDIPAAPPEAAAQGAPMDRGSQIVFGVFFLFVVGTFTCIGLFIPQLGWFLYVFLIPFWALFPFFIFGPFPGLSLLAVYLIGFPIGKIMLPRTAWYRRAMDNLKKRGAASVGGYTFDDASGSSSSSSGSDFSSGGSDSFSGGGGDSGGGGSSGSW
jgi:uncharacterized protein